jgi:putative DNA primase/helicase
MTDIDIKFYQRGDGRLDKPDDDIIARVLAQEWAGKRACLRDEWFTWNGVAWIAEDTKAVKREIMEFLYTRTAGNRNTAGKVNSVEQLARWHCYVPDSAVDCGGDFIPLKNGLYDLTNHTLGEGKKELYITSQLDFPYDEDADCPNWRKFLNSSLVDEDGNTDWNLVSLVQEAVGYSLTAKTDMKKAFWLEGKPDSGKSTFVAALKALSGHYYAALDLSQMGSNRFLFSGIVGKRVIAATEADAGAVLPDALFKTLVSPSDDVYADRKNKDAITFRPTAKLWWAMNKAPIVTDRSGAVFNRLIIIPFNRSVPQSERILNLLDLLTEERSGIFNWAMVGYKRLARAGQFTDCQQSVEKRRDYQKRSDTEGLYLDECCDREAGSSTPGATLYAHYRNWCLDNGYRPKSAAAVAEDWLRLGINRTRQKGISVWHGVKIREVNLNGSGAAEFFQKQNSPATSATSATQIPF